MFKSSRNCHSSIFVTVYLTRGLFFFFKDVLRNIWAQLVSCPTLASQILAGMEEFASQISVTTKWTMSAVVHWVTWTHDALLPLTTHAEAPHVEMEGRVTSPVSTHSSANVLQAGLVRMCYFLKDTFSHSKSPISSSGNRGSMTSTDYRMYYSIFTGKNCQQADPCASNPCANGGECRLFDSQYICSCTPSFSGETCKQDVNECAQIPSLCKNGGVCINEVGTYRCNCPAEYTGKHCETLYQPCNPSPCHHGGTCVQIGDTNYECSCLPGRKA